MFDVAANKDILSRFLTEVWNNGDIEACDRYIAAKYTIHHDPGDPWDKRELDLAGYRERVTLSRAPFPDQAFTIQELVGEGQKVVVSWLWSGTHSGDIPGFPATGRRIEMSGITVYFFAEGRLTGHWQVTDRLGVFMQLRQSQRVTPD
jgi:steroid delta-isomerase-like uncharacterized protein